MTWMNHIPLLKIVPRRRVIVSALVYGLSLSVRFTSATGEQVEVSSLATGSIMARDETQTSHAAWPLIPTEPIALRLSWPLVGRRCHATCERPESTALAPTCGAF